MNNSYTIKDLIQLFLSKIWLILEITVLGAVIGFTVSKFALPEKFSSHITLYVQSYTDIKDDNTANDISKSKQLIETYITLLGQDDYVMKIISDDLKKEFDDETLKKCFHFDENDSNLNAIRESLSLTSVTDTSAINAVATTKNAEVSASILRSLKYHANDIVKEAVGVGSIHAVSVPKVFYEKVSPNVAKNSAMGAAAGLMLIILIVLVIDFFDNTVKDAEDLSEKYQKPILGEIDEIVTVSDGKKRKKADSKKRVTLLEKDIPFNVTESYKSMRTNILFSLSTSDRKVFVVSSANPGEGKSTTAANIAITLAQGNYKTLLIDGDLRKPIQLSHVFNIKREKGKHKNYENGFSTVLGKMAKWEDCIISDTGVENLHLMPAGKIPPNPSELLGSSETEKVLNELSGQYDYIIIDGSPVGPVGDCYTLSKIIAGMLLVVKYNSTTFEDIDSVLAKCQLADMNVIGICLNDITGNRYGSYSRYGRYGSYKKYGYYRKGYSYTYSYGETPKNDEQES